MHEVVVTGDYASFWTPNYVQSYCRDDRREKDATLMPNAADWLCLAFYTPPGCCIASVIVSYLGSFHAAISALVAGMKHV